MKNVEVVVYYDGKEVHKAKANTLNYKDSDDLRTFMYVVCDIALGWIEHRNEIQYKKSEE